MEARCNNCAYKAFPRLPDLPTKKASLLIVGEAPSVSEVRTQLLFSSPGGDVLRETLRKVGLPLEDIYYTNALNCVPPKIQGKKTIDKQSIKNCQSRLVAEIEAVNPRTIVVLGNTALHAVLNDTTLKITEQQGRAIYSDRFPNSVIIPAIHPAKLIHTPGEYKIFFRIIAYAAQVHLDRASIRKPSETVYTVLRDEASVTTFCQLLRDKKTIYLGCDIETTGLNPRIGDILTIGIAYDTNLVAVFTPSAFPYLNMVLENPDWRQIWHNGKFDVSWLKRRGYMGRIDEDTQLMHYCTNETSGTHDLEQLSQLLLGVEAYKSEANRYIKSADGFASAPEVVLHTRVAVDADNTRQLFFIFLDMLDRNPLLTKLYKELLLPSAETLRTMERRGMLIDVAQMEYMRTVYQQKIAAQLAEVNEQVASLWNPELYKLQTGAKSAPAEFNSGSTKQLAWLLFDKLRLRPRKRKKRSTDVDVLLSLAKSDDPVIALAQLREQYPYIAAILDLRTIKKELSTYVEGMLARKAINDRVHSTFSLFGTTTGRLSSKQPNVQNIPSIRKDIRKAFIAPPGHVLIETDYKGAELRVLAHLSGIGKLGEALIAGKDLHDELSIRFWGPDFTKAQRMIAKTINFGM